MLSIGNRSRGAEGYYLRAAAAGVEDYYLGSGEASGHWLDGGAELLGLSGTVHADGLRAVRRSSDPPRRVQSEPLALIVDLALSR